MIEIYKITSKKYDQEASNFMRWRKDFTSRDTGRGNSQKIFTQRPRLDVRKYSFTVRAANVWNSLPESVINANSMNTFKNRLDKFWCNQDILYNYKSAINSKAGNYLNSREQEKEPDIEDQR